MPDIAHLVAAAALALPLAGCMVPQAYGEWRGAQGEAFTVAEIRQDPAAFLAAHAGQRVQVEGWFVIDSLNAGAAPVAGSPASCMGAADRDQRVMLPGMVLNRTVFPQALHHLVVVEGVVSAPRDLALGGGDLTVTVASEDMALVLDQARLVAADWSGEPCAAGPIPGL